MSYTEIRQEQGMPYGGMPYDSILYKLEETDIGEQLQLYEDEKLYKQYVRSEIIDWRPDQTFLESDHPRRDTALSKSIINLRYAGGRGSEDDIYPRHPELFIGFSGNDPRGTSGQPRLDQIKTQTSSRSDNIQVRMGKNVGHGKEIEANRPWSGTTWEYDKKEMARRIKKNLIIFKEQKQNKPMGGGFIFDESSKGGVRLTTVEDGDESVSKVVDHKIDKKMRRGQNYENFAPWQQSEKEHVINKFKNTPFRGTQNPSYQTPMGQQDIEIIAPPQKMNKVKKTLWKPPGRLRSHGVFLPNIAVHPRMGISALPKKRLSMRNIKNDHIITNEKINKIYPIHTDTKLNNFYANVELTYNQHTNSPHKHYYPLKNTTTQVAPSNNFVSSYTISAPPNAGLVPADSPLNLITYSKPLNIHPRQELISKNNGGSAPQQPSTHFSTFDAPQTLEPDQATNKRNHIPSFHSHTQNKNIMADSDLLTNMKSI